MHLFDVVLINMVLFSTSFGLTNSLVNDVERPSLNYATFMANYSAFLSSTFPNPKMIRSSLKNSPMGLSSRLN